MDFGIYWLRLNPVCAMSELCDFRQLPPAKLSFLILKIVLKNLMYLMRNLMYFIPDEKLDNAGAFLSWYTLREKPILLLYFAYSYDSANSYAEHP